MNKFMQSVTAFMLAISMVAAPVAEAQTRGRAGQSQSTGSSSVSRSSSSSRQSGSRQGSVNGGNRQSSGSVTSRPSTGTSRPSTGSTGSTTTYRQGGNTAGSNRNGNVGNNTNRNGNGGNMGNNQNRPGNNHGGNMGNNGMNRPGNNGGHRTSPAMPHRDYGYIHPVPFFRSFSRPVPPASWHYAGGGPLFSSILGVALGSAISYSVAALVNAGYTVSSYADNVIYLQNVPQMNYTWTDAAMYYNNGILYGSQFTYPTAYYDMNRYNNLYTTFVSQYGAPVQLVNNGGVVSASWFGMDNRYITLSYGRQGSSYYTTLSFGN